MCSVTTYKVHHVIMTSLLISAPYPVPGRSLLCPAAIAANAKKQQQQQQQHKIFKNKKFYLDLKSRGSGGGEVRKLIEDIQYLGGVSD